MKAYKTYRFRINLIRTLIFAGVALLLVVVMLVVFL